MTGRQKWLAFFVVLVAAALRFDRIWLWSLDGDEFYAWRDVQWLLEDGRVGDALKSHPIGYLGMAAVCSVFGMTEWSARLFSTVMGTLAVVLLLRMRRDVIPARLALIMGGWAALSPWLIYHAQTARVYGPLFFFATLAVMWWLPGEKRRPWGGLVALLLATATHPSALVVAPGVLVAGVISRASRKPALGVAGVGLAVFAGLLAFTDSTVVRLVREAFERRDFASYDAMHYVLGLGYNSHGVLLPAGLGVLAFLAMRRERLGWPVAMAFIGPGLLGVAALLGVSVHQRYAMAAIPAVYLVAGWGVETLLERGWRKLAVLVAVVPFVMPIPAVIAHMRDGNRHDWRAIAQQIVDRASPEDIIAADEHALLEVYLGRHPGYDDEDLHHEVPFEKDSTYVGILGNRRDCWVVVKASRIDGGYGDTFRVWLDEHFEEVLRWGSPPVPLTRHDNTLVLFRRIERVLDR